MILFIISYLAGVLTIATPCIFPILPFVLTRADTPFRRGGLPMLLGLSITFAVVASLASLAGGWAVEANLYGRSIALAVMTLVGLTMLVPELAERMARPLVSLGARLAAWAGHRATARGPSAASSLLLGVATGLVWAPCAGPVLGLILTGAALRGPNVKTTLLLLAYALGAATGLAAGMSLGGRLLAAVKRSVRWGNHLRRLGGATVIAASAIIWLGLDTGLLTTWSSPIVSTLESHLLGEIRQQTNCIMSPARADALPALSGPLASLLTTRQWLNTPPLAADDLRGKVVLVNFWTYSCINCLRMLPHVRAWAQKYGDRGLLVVGVHTPEFAFEKDAAGVRKAIAALGVLYPVAVDSDFGIWRAFGNQAWPALYLIGADGRIRHHVLGEGRYEETERLLQRLLSKATPVPVPVPVEPVSGEAAQAAADTRNLRSGETYLGFTQAAGFASPGGARRDVAALYGTPSALPIDRWALAGRWTVGGEFATLNVPHGRIAYRFHARDLHIVLAPDAPNRSIRFRVTLDGAPPGANRGADVDAEGWGRVQDGRLYQLIRQSGPITDRRFEIEFFDAGVRAYAFTFG